MFIFGGIALVANSDGHLGQIESFALGRTVRFGSMEYTTDCHGELIFTSLVPRRVKEQHEQLISSPTSDQAQDERENFLSRSISYLTPKPLPLVLISDQV